MKNDRMASFLLITDFLTVFEKLGDTAFREKSCETGVEISFKKVNGIRFSLPSQRDSPMSAQAIGLGNGHLTSAKPQRGDPN